MTASPLRHLAWPPVVLVLLAFVTGVFVASGTAPHAAAGAPDQTVSPDHIVVRGRIYYTDRLGDKNHPAAGLKAEIWDLDSGFPSTGEKLAEVTLDASGRFESQEISNDDRDGPTGQRAGTQDLFLKLFTDNGHVRLLKTGTTQDYSWNGYEINERDGLMRDVPDGLVAMPPLFINESTQDIGAMWTFVNLADAWLYMQAASGEDPGDVTAYWAKTSQDGPRYDIQNQDLHFRDEDAGYAQRVVYYEAFALLHNIYGVLARGMGALHPDCHRRPPQAGRRGLRLAPRSGYFPAAGRLRRPRVRVARHQPGGPGPGGRRRPGLGQGRQGAGPHRRRLLGPPRERSDRRRHGPVQRHLRRHLGRVRPGAAQHHARVVGGLEEAGQGRLRRRGQPAPEHHRVQHAAPDHPRAGRGHRRGGDGDARAVQLRHRRRM